MEADKPHEVYFTASNYYIMTSVYRRQQKTQYTQEEYLVLAKAYFLDEQYENCIEILNKINPLTSTKILFQRQSLLFRAVYLQRRKQMPQAKDFKYLQEIIAQFDLLKTKVPGPPFKPHHLQKIQSYQNFISFLHKYATTVLTFNEKLTRELQKADKSAHKLTGFPCYLIAEQWIDDFITMKRSLQSKEDKIYMAPITNFAIINDIFQAHNYRSQLDNYKNIHLFPTNKYKVVSKKLWTFYCSLFSPQNQFFPIKRLFQQRTYVQYSYSNTNFQTVQLIPLVVDCQNNRTIFNLEANQLLPNQLLPLVQENFGPGELKIPKNEETSFDLFYFGQKLQKVLAALSKILSYEKKKLPDHLKNLKIFNYLQYNPIPPTALLNNEGGLRGLQNLGNSCYLSSVIQCLSFTQELCKNLTTTDFSQVAIIKKEECDLSVTLAFSDLLKQLWRAGENKYVNPYKFKKYFGMKNTMFSQKTQEDAHQFLLHLLNSIHEDIKTGNSKIARSLSKLQVTTNVQDVKKYFNKHQLQQNKSLITQMMRGIYHTTILCNNCKTYSHAYDSFLALSIPVPYVSYPYIRFYYVPHKARISQKYELTLKGVTNINQLFTIFMKEVIDVKAEATKFKLGDEQSPQKTPEVTKKNYILIAFSTQKDPKELWNFYSSNQLTQKQIKIGQLLQEKDKSELIFYEVEVLPPQQQLVLVQYKYKSMLSSQKAIGIPKFLVASQESIKKNEARKFKKTVIQNNYEDRIYQGDFQDIKMFQLKNPSFKYCITTFFRRQEKLFLSTNFIDKQLNSSSDTYDIKDCLKQMSKPDILQGWKCGHCNHSKIAEKLQHITQINKILIISLKRFQANGNKIKNMIQYPLQALNMKEWLEDKQGLGNQLYDLYGVCFHSGTMQYGHYRAYCKHFITGEWYEFDDQRVRKIQPSDAITSQAYMLFYKQRQI